MSMPADDLQRDSPLAPERARNHWHEYVIYCLVTAGLLALGALASIVFLISVMFRLILSPFKSLKSAAIATLVAALAIFALYWSWYTRTVDLGERVVSIWVREDMTFGEMTRILDNEKALSYPTLFRLSARIQGIDRRLWIGRYDFTGAVSPRSIIAELRAGNVATFQVTIPEGLRVTQTAGILATALKEDSALIARRCYDTLFCRDRFGLPNLEGFLYPETYKFPLGADIDAALERMVNSSRDAITRERGRAAIDSDSLVRRLTDVEIMTLASIIEAEATEGTERRTISSVYHNRLRRSIALQADPTVRFALNLYHRRLFYKDLDKDHPYNTYRRRGLPPGPINSPGEASIAAALNPETTDYLYFVADGNGKHVFSRTVREHNRAKEATREGRRRERLR
ncbi:MAG: endolytic transglycosylase MltG [Candidatus Zixiibacteriota bacterium]